MASILISIQLSLDYLHFNFNRFKWMPCVKIHSAIRRLSLSFYST